MHHLESRRLVTPHGGSMPDIPRLAFERGVLDHNVRRLKNPDRKRVGTILADCFEEARKEGRADDLELEGLWVGDFDGACTVVCPVHPFKILFVGALYYVKVNFDVQ
jgi:hypothetical protein